MTALWTILAGVSLLAGALFALLGGIGVWRLPDLYSRSHAASKVGTVGASLVLLALAQLAEDPAVSARALAGIALFLLTAPVAAHLLARAAYRRGYGLGPAAVRDELAGAAVEPDILHRAPPRDTEGAPRP